MHYSKYDLQLIAAMIGVRKLRGLKQENVANDLGTYRTYIAKMENGKVVLRIGQLNQIAAILKTSLVNLLKVAGVIDMLDIEISPVEEIIKAFTSKSEKIDFTREELFVIFSEMKRSYPELRTKTKANLIC
jgi:transcriptional regulator with XRE-family HTH domain